MTPLLNTTSYPGHYDPSVIIDYMSDAFNHSVPSEGPFTRSARDVVIGSIQKDLGYTEKQLSNSIEEKERKYRTKQALLDLPAPFREYYSQKLEAPEEIPDAKLTMAIYFSIPKDIMKSTNIHLGNLFSVLSIPDCSDLIDALENSYETRLEEFMEDGLDARHKDQVKMYWAPWAEIASVVAN